MLIERFSTTFNYSNSLRIACDPSFMLSVPLTGKLSLRHTESFWILNIVKHKKITCCGLNLQTLKTGNHIYDSVTPPNKTTEIRNHLTMLPNLVQEFRSYSVEL